MPKHGIGTSVWTFLSNIGPPYAGQDFLRATPLSEALPIQSSLLSLLLVHMSDLHHGLKIYSDYSFNRCYQQ